MVSVLVELLLVQVCGAPSVTLVDLILVERATFPAVLATVIPSEPIVRILGALFEPTLDAIVVVPVLLKTKPPIVGPGLRNTDRSPKVFVELKTAVSVVAGTPAAPKPSDVSLQFPAVAHNEVVALLAVSFQ